MTDFIVYQLYRAIGFVLGLLPLGWVVRLGRLVGFCGYFIAGKYRGIALRNLAIAFPEQSAAELRALARRHFATLIGNLFAAEKIGRLSRDGVKSIVTIEGREVIDSLIAEKRGIVPLVSHIGNWELLSQIWPVVFPCPGGSVYQELGTRYIDAHVRRTRGRLGLSLFERKEGFTQAMDMLRKGGAVGVLFDQHAGDAGVWCPLFGRLASTTSLPAMLALRTKAALVPLAMHTDGVGKWKLVIEHPVVPCATEPGAVTAQLNIALERQIRSQPADWFWVHNRWKTPKPEFLLTNYKRGISYATPEPPALKPFRMLIRSSNWLGDAVMTVPALLAIKRGRPDAHITVLTPAKLADVYRQIPEVDEIIAVDAPTGKGLMRKIRGLFHVFTVARAVKRRAPFEVAILFPNSVRTAIEVWLAGIPRRVGYPGHSPRSRLLNQVFREKPRKKKDGPAPAPVHQVNHYLRLAKFIGADVQLDQEIVELAPPLPVKAGRSPIRIAVCPGAEYGPAKRWFPERFAEVMCAASKLHEIEWHLVGTAKDRPVAEEIERHASLPGVRNSCGQTSLQELIELLKTCRALVTNDTGTMHLAALLGLRTVSIFGSTEPILTGPLGRGHIVIRRHVECSPCFLRECPIDFRCMKSVESAEVTEALLAVIRGDSR